MVWFHWIRTDRSNSTQKPLNNKPPIFSNASSSNEKIKRTDWCCNRTNPSLYLLYGIVLCTICAWNHGGVLIERTSILQDWPSCKRGTIQRLGFLRRKRGGDVWCRKFPHVEQNGVARLNWPAPSSLRGPRHDHTFLIMPSNKIPLKRPMSFIIYKPKPPTIVKRLLRLLV